MSNQTQLTEFHKEVILKQFKLCYGMKQLIQDGKDEALRILATRSGFRYDFLKSNINTLKSLEWQS